MTTLAGSVFVIAFALLTFRVWQLGTTLYWRMPSNFVKSGDILGSAHSEHLEAVRARLGSSWTLPLGFTLLALALTPWWRWEAIDPHGILKPIVLLSSGLLTWRAVTMDAHLVTGAWHPRYRVLMLASWAGIWLHPALLILLVHTGVTWLRSNYHHNHLPIRILILFLAALGAVPLVGTIGPRMGMKEALDPTTPILFLFLCMSASHYLIPGIGKLKLGPHWYSWPLDNRLHVLMVSAYLWGWLRFLPERWVTRFARRVRVLDRPFQIATLAIELGAIAILFDQRLCVGLLAGFVMLQGMIFVLAGILFWHNMAVNAALAWSIANLPESVAVSLFGWESGWLAALVLLALPHRSKVWRPATLAWWDTPFVQRIHRAVEGESGTWYGLNNDFMCPDERAFGQTYGSSLSKEKRITKHIGETPRRRNRDAIRAVGKDLSRLEDAKQELGHSPHDASQETLHDRYMTIFVERFNAGCRKRVVPWWVKAPGGQLFYWSELPRFKGQEPIRTLVVRYKEQYFDGERIHLVRDDLLRTLTF